MNALLARFFHHLGASHRKCCRVMLATKPAGSHEDRSAHRRVRQQAARELGERRDIGAIPCLVSALAEEDVRFQAAQSLVAIGEPAVDTLLALLSNDSADKRVRTEAIGCLAKIGDPRAVPPILALLQRRLPPGDADFSRRRELEALHESCLQAVGALGDPSAARAVEQVVHCHDRGFAELALKTLGGLRERGSIPFLQNMLNGTKGRFRRRVLSALAEIDEQSASSHRDKILDQIAEDLKSERTETREEAVADLATVEDPRAVSMLIGTLHDQEDRVRDQAAKQLARRRLSPDLDALRSALKAPDASVRLTAIKALRATQDPALTGLAIEVMRDDKLVEVRAEAAALLGEIRGSAAVEPMVALLTASQHPYCPLRVQLVRSLGALRDARAVEPLIAVLQDRACLFREDAARSLARLQDERAVEPLLAASHQLDAAAGALAGFPALEDYPAWHERIAALEREFDDIDQDVTQRVQDKNKQRRLKVIELLAPLGRPADAVKAILLRGLKDRALFQHWDSTEIGPEFSDSAGKGVIGTLSSSATYWSTDIAITAAKVAGRVFKGRKDADLVAAILDISGEDWQRNERELKQALEDITGLPFTTRFAESRAQWAASSKA